MKIIGVTESVVQYLRVHIITGDLGAGQRLNEIELSSSLNVSRPPIREAFRVLENESLAVSVPRKGCFVTEVTMEDCHNIFEVRAMIECFAIDLLASKKISHIPRAKSVLKNTSKLSLPPEKDAYERYRYLRSIADFHIQIVKQSGNARLISLYDRIFPSLARYQSLYTYIPGLMDNSHQEHEDILQLITLGKYAKAKKMLGEHINSFIKLIKERVMAYEKVPKI